MRILTCLKRVLDLGNIFSWDTLPQSPAEIDWAGSAGRMSRYDEYAVEVALQLRETYGASCINAITVGDEDAGEVLRRAIGMGVDHGVHVQQPSEMFPSPFTVGARVAAYAREKAYDLILCGVMSEDLMQGLVGPITAGLLKWPCLTSIHTVNYREGSRVLRCEREVEGGRQEVLEVGLPALLTIQSGIQAPRYPTLSKLLRANKYPLETIAAEPLANTARRQKIIGIRLPERMRAGVMIEGSGEDKARQLAALLQAKGLR